jgi:hypothetical protein
MLQRLRDHIATCLDRALDADQRAEQTRDPATKHEYSQLARSWRHLARSYQFVESLESFLLDERGQIPRRMATCRFCGKEMRLISSEPHELFKNLDLYRFSCDCGNDAEMYIARET